eukprot:2273330-Amphidinium_carterae.1
MKWTCCALRCSLPCHIDPLESGVHPRLVLPGGVLLQLPQSRVHDKSTTSFTTPSWHVSPFKLPASMLSWAHTSLLA